MDKKALKKRRMMGYFVEATNKLMEEEGSESLTIRRIADMAGYNSATLYNYFEDMDHLVFFASMRYLKTYVLSLPDYVKNAQNALEKYLSIWECFCCQSFHQPKIYQAIFFDKYSNRFKDAIQEYYLIFPEELGDPSEDLLSMLLKQNILERNISALENCVRQGFFRAKDVEEISEITLLIYQGMLARVIAQPEENSVEETVVKTLKYFKRLLESYKVK